MKANELMIGDWVRIKSDINSDDAYWMHDNMHTGQVLKVEEILSNGINPDWYGGEINDYIPEDALLVLCDQSALHRTARTRTDEVGMGLDSMLQAALVAGEVCDYVCQCEDLCAQLGIEVPAN